MASPLLTHIVIAISWFTPTPRSYVYVKDCRGVFKILYSDSREIIPLPNPFLSDSQGDFTFFTEGDCTLVSVDGGKRYFILETLPAGAR